MSPRHGDPDASAIRHFPILERGGSRIAPTRAPIGAIEALHVVDDGAGFGRLLFVRSFSWAATPVEDLNLARLSGYDVGTLPQPTGAVAATAGETWPFPACYRDGDPTPTSNFTSAIEVDLRERGCVGGGGDLRGAPLMACGANATRDDREQCDSVRSAPYALVPVFARAKELPAKSWSGCGPTLIMTALLASLAAIAAISNDLDHDLGFALRPPATDAAGYGVRSAGDVNGDAIDDVLTFGERQTGPGMVVRVLSGTDGEVLHEFLPTTFDFLARCPMDGVGDLNGDGRDDIVVGDADLEEALVYSGADGSILHRFQATIQNSGFGGAVSGGGDVDLDGTPDVIVGSRSSVFPMRPGLVRVYSGATGALLYEFRGRRPTRGFGEAVAHAGDCNGDGRADIVIGSMFEGTDFLDPGFPSGGGPPFRATDASGAVYVYSGADGSLLHRLVGTDAGARLGYTVAGAGDVNGDGLDDIVAGTRDPELGAFGYARVFSGATGQVLHTFLDDVSAPEVAVDGVGDLNRDGFDDVLVATTNSLPRQILVFSGATGDALFSYNAFSLVQIGGPMSVSRGGDLNGDGLPDFLVSVPQGAYGTGVTLGFVSTPGPGEPYCTATVNSTGSVAHISTTGTASVSANAICLVAEPVPNTLGSFLYGTAQTQVPAGDGFLCVGGSSAFLPPSTAVGGLLSHPLDLTAPPAPPFAITPGSTWNFQAWFRDPAGGGLGSNLSDGLRVMFKP